MAEDRSALGTAIDALVYAPIGFLLTAGEELPRLAAKGRESAESQFTMARVVGELAVAHGRKEAARLADQLSETTARMAGSATWARAGTEPGESPTPVAAGPTDMAPARRSSRSRPSSKTRSAGKAPGPDGPSAAALAIPGYDSLSASHVVSRLAGLSRSELDRVQAYESATRGRRTILTRIAQLQAP